MENEKGMTKEELEQCFEKMKNRKVRVPYIPSLYEEDLIEKTLIRAKELLPREEYLEFAYWLISPHTPIIEKREIIMKPKPITKEQFEKFIMELKNKQNQIIVGDTKQITIKKEKVIKYKNEKKQSV